MLFRFFLSFVLDWDWRGKKVDVVVEGDDGSDVALFLPGQEVARSFCWSEFCDSPSGSTRRTLF